MAPDDIYLMTDDPKSSPDEVSFCWFSFEDLQLHVSHRFGEVIYQTKKTVFDHSSKHGGESWKYNMLQSIFDELLIFVWVVFCLFKYIYNS